MNKIKYILTLFILCFVPIYGIADDSKQKAAAGNTNAAKYDTDALAVSVNTHTGSVTINSHFPAISAISHVSPSIAYDSSMDLSYYNGGQSVLGLPIGWYYKDIPFMLNKGAGEYVLYLNGSGYYVDNAYQSIKKDKTIYKSGLRYQASEFFKLEQSSGALTLVADDKQSSEINYTWKLTYKNGNTYYFHEYGLLLAITDKFYDDNTPNNIFHVTQFDYTYPLANSYYNASRNQLKSIQDGLSNIKINYLSVGGFSITYPENSSSKAYYVRALTTPSEQMANILISLGKDPSSGAETYSAVSFQYLNDNKVLPTNLKLGIATDKDSIEVTYAHIDKHISLNYQQNNTDGSYQVAALSTSSGDFQKNNMTTYHYIGSSNAGYQFGADTMMNTPNGDPNDVYYSTIVINKGLQVERQYNYLHNEIISHYRYCTEILTGCQYLARVEKSYLLPVPYKAERLLPTAYTDPIKIVSYTYDKKGLPVFKSQVTKSYNDSGKVTKTQHFLSQSIDINDDPTVYLENNTTYDEHYLLPIESTQIDHISGSEYKKTNTLDNNDREMSATEVSFKNINNKNTDWSLEKKMTYTYSSNHNWCQNNEVKSKKYPDSDIPVLTISGMLCSTTVTDLLSGKSGTHSTVYAYQADKKNKESYGTMIHYDVNSLNHILETHYDAFDNKPTLHIDPLGYTSEVKHDVSGRVITQISPSGLTSKVIYDDINQQVIHRKPNGFGTRIHYDYIHKVLTKEVNTIDPETWTLLQTNEYESAHQKLSKVTGHFGNSKTYTYDNFARVSAVTDNFKNQTNFSHDAKCDAQFGCYRLKTSQHNNQDAKGILSTNYRQRKKNVWRQTTVAGLLTHQSSHSYNGIGKPIASNVYDVDDDQLPIKLNTQYHYADNGLLESLDMSTHEGFKASKAFIYDTLLNKVTQTTLQSGDFIRHSPVKTYSLIGQVTQSCYLNPADKKEKCLYFKYRDNKTPAEHTDFMGNKINYQYDDKSDYLISKVISAPNEVTKNIIQYAYAPDTGWLTQITDQKGYTINPEYDYAGRTASIEYTNETTHATHQYKQKIEPDTGHLLETSVGEGSSLTTIDYTYNSDGSLQTQTSNHGDHIAYSYYPYIKTTPLDNHKMKVIDYQIDLKKLSQSYQYDAHGHTQAISYQEDNKVLFIANHTYNPSGSIKDKSYTSDKSQDSNLNNTTTYTYNDLNQLLESKLTYASQNITQSYQYDPVGNLMSKTESKGSQTKVDQYTYDTLNRLLKRIGDSPNKTFTYNDNGNVIEAIIGSDTNQYTYDAQNQLIRYLSQGKETTYGYYPSGLRAFKQSGDDPIGFLYDTHGQMISEYQRTQHTSYLNRFIRYLYNSDDDMIKQMIMSSGKDSPLTKDFETGKETSTYMDDYGKQYDLNKSSTNEILVEADIPISITENPFKYGASYYDPESKHYYMKARYYDPDVQRFVARDSYDLMNRYAYANGNPIMNIDPSGHSSQSAHQSHHVSKSGLAIGILEEIGGIISIATQNYALGASLMVGGAGDITAAVAQRKGIRTIGNVVSYASIAIDVGTVGVKMYRASGALRSSQKLTTEEVEDILDAPEYTKALEKNKATCGAVCNLELMKHAPEQVKMNPLSYIKNIRKYTVKDEGILVERNRDGNKFIKDFFGKKPTHEVYSYTTTNDIVDYFAQDGEAYVLSITYNGHRMAVWGKGSSMSHSGWTMNEEGEHIFLRRPGLGGYKDKPVHFYTVIKGNRGGIRY